MKYYVGLNADTVADELCKIEKHRQKYQQFPEIRVGPEGFEPSLTDSESVVLPLH